MIYVIVNLVKTCEKKVDHVRSGQIKFPDLTRSNKINFFFGGRPFQNLRTCHEGKVARLFFTHVKGFPIGT